MLVDISPDEHQPPKGYVAAIRLSPKHLSCVQQAAKDQHVLGSGASCRPTLVEIVDEKPHFVLFLDEVLSYRIVESANVAAVDEFSEVCSDADRTCGAEPSGQAVDLP